MSLSVAISFKTERFDYQSELSADINAGNQFYGKDVAEFLVQQLNSIGLEADFLDEDWGWLVISLKNQTPIFHLEVYNLAEYKGASGRGIPEWGLLIRAYENRRILGLISKKHEIPVPTKVVQAIESSIRAAGAVPMKWEDGPGDA